VDRPAQRARGDVLPHDGRREAVKNGPENSFDLVWASVEDLEPFGLHPAEVREPLARLLAGAR
jgi:hypothetical protein